ncbi:arylsulfatase [Flexithrix dorotheae]|uniref:arylsulfatase n=1 Tax=Flexithrix dorotheae TaxID=70993 RepID=UPI000369CBA0|nr:arylsulfatase [Flexithrix dorotheae]
MKNSILAILSSLIFIACNTAEKEAKPPNIIYFLADDLGYGEVGIYGQEKIKTPNMDALAQNGMRFTQHYSGAPVCAPARCVLLTGKHSGHAYIRGNDEWKERGDVWNYEKAFSDPKLEGQRPIPANTVTIGKLLQRAGYTTGVFGKWGLGAPETEGVPTAQGFDYFYGYNCQRQAHNLYPGHLWENNEKVLLENELVSWHTKLDSLADPYDEKSYAKFQQKDYAPAKIHEKALEFIQQNKAQPFFMYYASPLPHLPLQAPQKFVEQYREVFGEEEPYLADQSYFPNRTPRATYAAMITYLDFQLGELVATLKEMGVYENTLIIVSSDNGPTYLGGVDFEYFESSDPFTNGYGRTKGFVYEGGIRVPMIASWPDHIKAGSVSQHISAFYDIMPTFCDIVGVEAPKSIDGISFKPALLGQEQEAHDFLYWEFPSYKGQQAVRMGKWKGIRTNIFEGNMAIELYDLENDMQEKNNVADQHPEIVKKIESIMLQEHQPAENEKFKMVQLGD